LFFSMLRRTLISTLFPYTTLFRSCSVLTIRFYEKEGLIPEPERTEGNYRLYDVGYVERIKFILNCRTLNMSLNEIRQLLTYKDKPEKNCSDVNELIDLHV